MNNHDFRKYSTFIWNPADPRPNLTLRPNLAPGVILEGEDYDLKTRIDGLPRGGSGPIPY